MYLKCLSLKQPTGLHVTRRLETDFRPEIALYYLDQYAWLDYLADRDNIKISHRLNSSSEICVQGYRTDGYCAENDTAYQFQGCYLTKIL